ncbi:MAG: hypothetical protein ABR599_09545 [Gemmatimonadota bacterium]
MPLRLNRLQLALGALAVALFVGAILALVLPPPEPAAAALPGGEPPPPLRFDPPLYAVANDPESPIVEQNPFESSRRPPERRWSAAAAADPGLFQPAVAPPSFTLLGTVVVPGGRHIAVIQGNPQQPGGATYHVGDEVLPGWRLTHVTRTGATLVGEGQRIDLEVGNPSTGEAS